MLNVHMNFLSLQNSNLTVVESELINGDSSVVHSVLENLHSAKERKVKVFLPRCKSQLEFRQDHSEVCVYRIDIQITHEWSSSSNKSLANIHNSTVEESDASGEGVETLLIGTLSSIGWIFHTGHDTVGVYQDCFLDLSESPDLDNSGGEKEVFEVKDKHNMKEEDGDSRTSQDTESDDDSDSKEFKVDQPFLLILELDRKILAIGRIKDPTWCKFCIGGPRNETSAAEKQDEQREGLSNHEKDEHDNSTNSDIDTENKNLFQRLANKING